MILVCTASKGTLRPVDPKGAAFLLRQDGKMLTVEAKLAATQRTLSQNKLYWSQIVPLVTSFLSEATGKFYTSDQTHYALKCAFIGTDETPLGPVPRSSAALSVEEFSTYIERISAHAASEWGLTILEPRGAA